MKADATVGSTLEPPDERRADRAIVEALQRDRKLGLWWLVSGLGPGAMQQISHEYSEFAGDVLKGAVLGLWRNGGPCSADVPLDRWLLRNAVQAGIVLGMRRKGPTFKRRSAPHRPELLEREREALAGDDGAMRSPRRARDLFYAHQQMDRTGSG